MTPPHMRHATHNTACGRFSSLCLGFARGKDHLHHRVQRTITPLQEAGERPISQRTARGITPVSHKLELALAFDAEKISWEDAAQDISDACRRFARDAAVGGDDGDAMADRIPVCQAMSLAVHPSSGFTAAEIEQKLTQYPHRSAEMNVMMTKRSQRPRER
ncbi:MAG: hypothetical protein SGPRY_013051 [Prymnesium sp.]